MEKDGSKGTAPDRRKLGRVDFKISLTLATGGRSVDCDETHDISAGGIFVVTDDPFDIGTTGGFVINLAAADAASVEIKGGFEVASHIEKEGKGGMGLTFKDLDPDSSMHLYRIVRLNQPDGK